MPTPREIIVNFVIGLELQLKAELHNTWTADRVVDGTEIGAVLQVICRVGEINVVKDIEDIPAELECDPFRDRCRLRKSHIEALLIGSAQDVATQVSDAEVIRISAGDRHR